MNNNIVSITKPPYIFIPQAGKPEFQFKGPLPEIDRLNSGPWDQIHDPSPVDYAFSNLSSTDDPIAFKIGKRYKEPLARILTELGHTVSADSIEKFHIDNNTGLVSIYYRINQDHSKSVLIGQFPVQDMVVKARFFDPTQLKLTKDIEGLKTDELEALSSLIKGHLRRYAPNRSDNKGAIMGFINKSDDWAKHQLARNNDQEPLRQLGRALAHVA